MKENIPFRIGLAVVVIGTVAACNNPSQVESGDIGTAKETVSLVTNPKAPIRERKECEIGKGESVNKGRDSYVSPDNGVTSADVTFIEGKGNCSGWSFNNDYLADFKWNK